MKTIILIAAFSIVDVINPKFDISEGEKSFYVGLFIVCIATDMFNFFVTVMEYFK